jgi:peptidoglycan/LPS O-acetylase OafA/YrhL
MHIGTYQPSIDGLRALAILLVVVFHAFPSAISGGYIGVDVFFIISGYLITSIILKNTSNLEFSFADFYSKRIRRIFPSLLIVLISCYALGWFVMLPGEYAELGKHIAAGAGFISNWMYWSESGYFDYSAELKPLLNLWSLGVEEQFYIIWPLMLVAAVKVNLNLRVVIWLFTLASFLLNVILISKYPVATFFLPFTRFWEIGLGGCLAVASFSNSYRLKPSLFWINLLSVLGLSAVIFPAFLLNSESVFPGWLAMIPVLGSALLIATGSQSWIGTHLLANRVMIYLGLISYPLYLWHWPIFSFAIIITGRALESVEIGVLLLLSIALAIATYELVEKKVRYKGRKTVFLLIFLMLLICFQAWNTFKRGGLDFRLSKNIQIEESLKADFIKWEDKGMLPVGNCSPGFIYPNYHVCLKSDQHTEPTIIVIGDSHAFSAYWGIESSYKKTDTIELIGQGGCLPFLNAGRFGAFSTCENNINSNINWISKSASVKTIIFVHRARNLENPKDHAFFEKSARDTFDLLIKNGKNIVYFYPVPELQIDPRLCIGSLPMARANITDKCTFDLKQARESQSQYKLLMDKVLEDYPMIKRFDPSSFLCDESGICHAVVNGKPMFMDANHLSASGSIEQGKFLADAQLIHKSR